MARSLTRWLLAALLGGAMAFLIACGDQNGLLARSDASRLGSDLDGVSSAVVKGLCNAADAAGQRLMDDVAGLPNDVDSRLRRKLREGASTVSEKAQDECINPQTPSTPSTPTDTTTTDTTTQPTETTVAPPSTATLPEPIPPPATETLPPPTGTTPSGGSGGAGTP